ncbi:hypothetical protein [Halosimplex sp. J119]
MEAGRISRNVAIPLAVAILVLIAACLGTQSSPPESSTPPTIDRNATDVGGTPVPGLPDDTAKQRALGAERAFLSDSLPSKSCVDDWGFSAPVVSKTAVIRNRTGDTVEVAVRHPFWYSSGNGHGDTYSTAIYFVTAEATDRERRSGPQIC